MLEQRISGIPVVDDMNQVVGMVTEGDLLRRVELGLPGALRERWEQTVSPEGKARDFVKSYSWKVADVMTSPVVSIDEGMLLRDVSALLETRRIRRVPVLRDGRLTGILSRADLLHCIVGESQGTIAQGDDAILISLQARLREAKGVLSTQPTVTIASGVVHLWGAVRSQAERDVTRVVVEGIPGVTGWEDHMSVIPPASAEGR